MIFLPFFKCSTSYEEQCSTSYETSYEEKCSTTYKEVCRSLRKILTPLFKKFSRFVPLAMADTVDMESNVRKFPHRAVSKSQFRSPWTSVSKSQENLVQRWVQSAEFLYQYHHYVPYIRSQSRNLFRTVSRFQKRTASRSQCRAVTRFLSRRRRRLPDKSVADADTTDWLEERQDKTFVDITLTSVPSI